MEEARFKKGQKVVVGDNNRKGYVISDPVETRAGVSYIVVINGQEEDVPEEFLRADFDISNPFDRLQNGLYGNFHEFLRINTSYKIRNSNNNTISSLKASRTVFKGYQYKPLLKFINSDNGRILIADEVGLGKTIEAGHIMLEMKARKELRHVLVICPMSLQEKWRDELRDRFGLSFIIYEDIKDLIMQLRGSSGWVHAILNYEKIRSVYDGEMTSNKKGEKKNLLLEFLEKEDKRLSLVVCDEAHRMRNNTTQIHKGAKRLLRRTEAAVLLTATPVMIDNSNLFHLLQLLDEVNYDNEQIFENQVRLNRPFVTSISKLNQPKYPLKRIADELQETEVVTTQRIGEYENTTTHKVGDYFGDMPLFQRIVRQLKEDDTPKNRASIQRDMTMMSPMHRLFSRTRKREVTTDMSQAERNPHLCLVHLYPEEQAVFDEVIDEYIDEFGFTDWSGEKRVIGDYILGLIQRKRQVASSVYGCKNDETSLLAGVDEYENLADAKFDELLRICKEVFAGGTQKLIVFALFKKTLRYLAIRLKREGIGAVTISGEVENRQEVLQEFRDNPSVRILLSSEVGSEGLDMQFCNSMVNYDLPWNPMVVEQRIGRIDRFGQKAEKVNIYNMVIAGSIQEDIYIRLLDRINLFRGTIGDMEAILDATVETQGRGEKTIQQLYDGMEREFYCKHLTEEERARKIDEIAQAIENERLNLEAIEKGLNDTMTNDAYFKEEINRILHNNAYVTENELKNFFELVLAEALPSCLLTDRGDNTYDLQIRESNPKALLNFLTQHHPNDDDSEKAFEQFRMRYKETRLFRITFNQEKAFENKTLTYINIYHLFMQSFLHYFRERQDENVKTFRFELKDESGKLSGHKVVAIMYEINVNKCIYDRRGKRVQKQESYMHPILFDCQLGQIIGDNDFAATFYGKMQMMGRQSLEANRLELSAEEVQLVRTQISRRAFEQCQDMKTELEIQHENERLQKERQIRERGQERISKARANLEEAEIELNVYKQYPTLETEIRKYENTVQLRRFNLEHEESDMAARLEAINADPEIRVSPNLIMINVLSVI